MSTFFVGVVCVSVCHSGGYHYFLDDVRTIVCLSSMVFVKAWLEGERIISEWILPVFPYNPGEQIEPLHSVAPALATVHTRVCVIYPDF